MGGPGLVQTQDKEYIMFQHSQMARLTRQRRPGTGDLAWLPLLVQAFEQASQADVRAVPTDEPVLLALKAQLVLPASLQQRCGIRFLH